MVIFMDLLPNFALFLPSFCLIGSLLVYFGFYFCRVCEHMCVCLFLFILFYFFKKELEKEQSREDLKVEGSGRN